MGWREHPIKINRRYDREARESKWFVEMTNGESYERDRPREAYALASILVRFDISVDEARHGFIPTDVAIDGKSAIATYLIGVHQYHEGDVAEKLSVKQSTVAQYLTRSKPRRNREDG